MAADRQSIDFGELTMWNPAWRRRWKWQKTRLHSENFSFREDEAKPAVYRVLSPLNCTSQSTDEQPIESVMSDIDYIEPLKKSEENAPSVGTS